jgi:single-strand selective monofunctional uracil DNA glycosylase
MPSHSPSVEALLEAARVLRKDVDRLRFGGPVAFVYNPLDYAWDLHAAYLRRFGAGPKRWVFLGMNPGPFGMAQTGVPFGEIAAVRDWLGLAGTVGRPSPEHPSRPVEGLACLRSEVSGRRLWGLFAERFGTAASFFREHFVANYCPLVFMSATGANLTPDKLPAAETAPLEEACDRHLRAVVTALGAECVVGVGGFAVDRANRALAGAGVRVARVLHPSPASPAANRGWAAAATRELVAQGIWTA